MSDQLFDSFLAAKNQEDVLGLFASIKEQVAHPASNPESPPLRSIDFYSELKSHIRSWRAQSIWKILDERVNHNVYKKNTPCLGRRLLTIGAGPVGLRMAIESAFLGGESHVIEKRVSATRNNILHLWPFTIDDLRRLGAKKFFGQFCAGAIDHISIRQLQLILLKICLIVGVHVHVGVEFRGLVEPTIDKKGCNSGWGINAVPHPLALPKWKWDGVVQASGRQHVLPLFQFKEFRGQQAIGMTVNFVNRGTSEELTIEEISGIAFIYNQDFFNEMHAELGISLENIVYYKDETHYFVMSTKKQSLLHKKVLKKDYPTTSELLSPDNIDNSRAQQFAKEVAGFATNLPVLDFMTNHHGNADLAIFDFSSIKSAASSSMVLERKGVRILTALVGDSLLEPFWPQGTGCARGFLSVYNTAWMFNNYFSGTPVYDALRERESLYKLLAQSTPLKLNSKHDKYTIDPNTRYNCWTLCTEKYEVFHLYNREETPIVSRTPSIKDVAPEKKRGREGRRKTIQITLNRSVSKEREEAKDSGSPTTPTLEQGSLLNWARESTCGYKGVRVTNLTTAWKSGLAFSALIHRYRPDILNYTAVLSSTSEQSLKIAFETTRKELGITSPFSAKELAATSIPDRHKIVQYLTALHSHLNSDATKSLQISPDMCYFCERHITPGELASSHEIKFHSSCLQCQHCRDKISVNSLHFVDPKMAEEFAARRKPGFPDCLSGFYCQFHFREFFTAKSTSIYPKNWADKDGNYIESTPSTATLETVSSEAALSDTEDAAVQQSHELRRAKSSASVRSLRDMFEGISTGNLADTPPSSVPNSPSSARRNMSPETPTNPMPFTKSKSFSGHLPSAKQEQAEVSASRTPKSNKRKSGVAKKIERRQESEKKQLDKKESEKKDLELKELQPSKQKKMNGEVRDPAQSYLHSDSVVINAKKKSRFKLFKKKKKPLDRPHSPIFSNTSDSNMDDTMSVIISNKSDTTGSTILESTGCESPILGAGKESSNKVEKSDPLYSIANPEFRAESPENHGEFVRNSLTRRTAPPKMNESEEIVESSSCRRTTATHRQAVVLQTDSPEARSLLRSSLRGSKRSQTAALVKQHLNFRSEDNITTTPGTPKSSRIQIAKSSSQQALVTPHVSEAHVISKTVYSPKPKRAQKVKLESIDLLRDYQSKTVSEARVVQKKKCSPMPQRSKKLRLTQKGVNPLRISSSSESDTPPARPELPDNLDLLLYNGRKEAPVLKDDNKSMESSSLVSLNGDVKMDDILLVEKKTVDDSDEYISSEIVTNGIEKEVTRHLTNEINTADDSLVTPTDTSYRSASKEITTTPSSANRTFMYAKKDQERLSGTSSVYRTPDSNKSDLSFFTPNSSFTLNSSLTESKHTVRIPAKRPSDSAEGAAKRYSGDIDENAILNSTLDKSTIEIHPPVSPDRKSVKSKTPSVSETKTHKSANESNTSSAINNILARYRKTAETRENNKEVARENDKDLKGNCSPREKRSISQRSISGSDKTKKQASSQNRVKMMNNISNSFDKKIDKLVSKYYPKKDTDKETFARQKSVPSQLSSSDKRRISRSAGANRQLSTPSREPNKQLKNQSNDVAKQQNHQPLDVAKQLHSQSNDVAKQQSSQSVDVAKQQNGQIHDVPNQRHSQLLDVAKQQNNQSYDVAKERKSQSLDGAKQQNCQLPDNAKQQNSHLLDVAKQQNCSTREVSQELSNRSSEATKQRGRQSEDPMERTSSQSCEVKPSTPYSVWKQPNSLKHDVIEESETLSCGVFKQSPDLDVTLAIDTNGIKPPESQSSAVDSRKAYDVTSRDVRRYGALYYRDEVKHHPSTASRFYRRSASSPDFSRRASDTRPISAPRPVGVTRHSSDLTKQSRDVSRFRYSSGSSTISRDSFSGKPGFRNPAPSSKSLDNPPANCHNTSASPSNHAPTVSKSTKDPSNFGPSYRAPSKSDSTQNYSKDYRRSIKSIDLTQESRYSQAKPRENASLDREQKPLPSDNDVLSFDQSPDQQMSKEDLPAALWDKKDYNRYLRSLRYSSSVTRTDTLNVRNTARVFQRKETDV